MSTVAKTVYKNQLDWQLSANGHHTSQAFFDPDGTNVEIWGIFGYFTEDKKEDSGHGFQKNLKTIFVVSQNSVLPAFQAKDNKYIFVVAKNKKYLINFKSVDEIGKIILWLS